MLLLKTGIKFYVSQLDCPYNENRNQNVMYIYKVVLDYRAECVEIIIDHKVIFGPLFPVALI